MLIKINDKYQVRGVPMNFVLEEKKVKSDKSKDAGIEYWNETGFYPNLEALLVGLLRRELQTSECEGIRAIIEEMRVSVGIILEQIKVLEEVKSENS